MTPDKYGQTQNLSADDPPPAPAPAATDRYAATSAVSADDSVPGPGPGAGNKYGGTEAVSAGGEGSTSQVGPRSQADDLVVVGELGRGGMGVVELAYHRVTRKWCAVKRVRPGAGGEYLRRRFEQESHALFGYTHAYAVKMFGFFPDPVNPRLVLLYAEGPNPATAATHPGWQKDWPNPPLDLERQVLTAGPLPPQAVAALGWKVADALAEFHREGLIHRDIKPANILLTKEGDPKLADFGLARHTDPSRNLIAESDFDALGTEGYSSPELRETPLSAGPPTDQYSLALTLYFLATGRRPAVPLRPDGLPPPLHAALARATQRNPKDRYPDMTAFADALRPAKGARMAQPVAARPAFAGPSITCHALGCDTVNPETARTCSKCGTSLWTTCLRCRAEMAVDRQACANASCGRVQADERKQFGGYLDGLIHKASAEFADGRFQPALDALAPAQQHRHPLLADHFARVDSLVGQIHATQQDAGRKAAAAWRAVWPEYAVGRYRTLAAEFAKVPPQQWSPRMTRMAADAAAAPKLVPAAKAALARLLAAWDVRSLPADAETADANFALFAKLAAYAKRIPHHRCDDLAEQAEVTAVQTFTTHFAELHTLSETRGSVLVLMPDAGSSAVPRTPHTDADPWACELPVPEAMADATATHPIPDYLKRMACVGCRESGKIVCTTCRGAKEVKCPKCRGANQVDCGGCDGRGRVEKRRAVTGYRDCGACRATGRFNGQRCRRCDGTGKEEYEKSETYSSPCKECMESGKLNCTRCHTKGVVRCGGCQETGREACPQCAGGGRVRQTATAKQSFGTAVKRTDLSPNDKIPPDLLRRLKREDYWQADEYVTPPGVTLFTVLADGNVRAPDWLTALVNATTPPEAGARLARQKLVVHRAGVARVQYEYKGREYNCWVTADRDGLVIDESPITDDLRNMIVEAKKDGDRRELALVVADAREMARADEGCADAFADLKPELGSELLEWSKTVWTHEQRNFIWTGAGVLAGGLLLAIVFASFGSCLGMFLCGLAGVAAGVACGAYGHSKRRK